MNRVGWISLTLALLVAATFFYDFDADSFDAEPKNASSVAKNSQLPANADVAMREEDGAAFQSADEPIDNTPAARTDSPASDAVVRWASVANSEDQKERSAAIDALATAPRVKVLPVLQKLIGSGTADDRESALNALHAIAVQQGDADGEIQNLLRLAIYDGDATLVGDAQLALEDIERGSDRMLLSNP